jgi:hypothetical protein
MKLFNRVTRRVRGRERKRSIELGLERFEDRFLLAHVTTTNPTGNGSLAAAIATGEPTIDFQIPIAGNNFNPATHTFTIKLTDSTSILPVITNPVVIDGTTESTFLGQTAFIEIDGNGLATDGLVLGSNGETSSAGSQINALDITGFAGAAIHVETANNLITGNNLGTDLSGTVATPGNLIGVLLDDVPNVTVGGTTAADQNTIGFNITAGVQILGASSSDNTIDLIEGNLIGTDAAGTADLHNGAAVQVFNASGNTIGGLAANGAANTIGFNTNSGVAILSGIGNVIRENSYTATNGNVTTPSVAANDIGLGLGANNNQPAPTLLSASLSASNTVLSLALGATSPTAMTLDVYKISSSPNQRIFLGSEDIPANAVPTPLTVAGVTVGDSIIATATVIPTASARTNPNNGTSVFSAPVTVAPATTVTNTNDSGPGSLRDAIASAASGDTILFQIPGSPGTFVINLASALPTLTTPVTIDGRTESTFVGGPSIIQINGGSFNGLTLGGGSDGSTIEGLQLENFAASDSAILVQSSNNTIGGTAAGAGNTLAFNGGAAVTVDTGTGNVLQQNLVFGSTPQTGYVLATHGNHNLAPPVITGVASIPGTTTVTLNVSGMSPGTYSLDFFASLPGDVTAGGGGVQAHTFLGAQPVVIIPTQTSLIETFATTLSAGQVVTVTSRVVAPPPSGLAAGDTSTFAAPVGVTVPFAVTTTADSGPGSLRDVIAAVDAAGLGAQPTVISFAIPGAGPRFVISVSTTLGALPPITVPVLLDGTTQNGFAGSPVVVIDGGGAIGDGLTLAPGSGSNTPGHGSTIQGLEVTGFTGNAILVQSSNNTIGGTAAGAGNVIDGNTGNAVDIASGNGNAIRENLISSASGTSLIVSANPAKPEVDGVASVPNLTTIDYKVTGTVGQAYTVEFFASGASGSPAAIFLGTATTPPLTTATQPFTASLTTSTSTFDITKGLAAGVEVTATVTAPDNSTSAFATITNSPAANAFNVTTLADSGVGSLRQAIINLDAANSSTPNTISFANGLSGVINLTGALPVITAPAWIKGSTTAAGVPEIELNGAGQAFEGLVLGLGSSNGTVGSTISGLSLYGFGSSTTGTTGFAGIHVLNSNNDLIIGNQIGVHPSASAVPGNAIGILIDSSSSNTVGGTAGSSFNTVGSNIIDGISVLSGAGNVIRGNTYTGTNGPVTQPPAPPPPPPDPSDIALAPNANNNPPTPVLLGGVVTATNPRELLVTVQFPSATKALPAVDLEFYQNLSSFNGSTTTWISRTFIASVQATPPATPGQSFTVSVAVPAGFSFHTPILATATFLGTGTDPSGTSVFSNSVLTTSTTQVTTTADDGSNTQPIQSSLRAAILFADNNPGTLITFAIPTSDPGYNPATQTWTITLLDHPLPPITAQTTLDGTSQLDPTTGIGFLTQAHFNPAAPRPVIEINGGRMAGDGLELSSSTGDDQPASTSDGSIIQGLGIYGFTTGIHVETGHNTIRDNWIGPSPSGNSISGNTVGILVDGSAANTVGSATDNTIGGVLNSVQVESGSSTTGSTTTGSSIISAANVIGLNSNSSAGVSSAGVSITGQGATRNVVLGNYVGTDASNDKLGNGDGIILDDAGGNSIGATIGGAINRSLTIPAWLTESVASSGSSITGVGNIIGFNRTGGLWITGTGAADNTVLANLIGINASSSTVTGTTSVVNAANVGNGINLGSGSQGNSIGALVSLPLTPTISGSITAAVNLQNPFSSSTPVTYRASVNAGVPVTFPGGLGNFIAANNGNGVALLSGATANSVVANTIGATTTTALLGNVDDGVLILNTPNNTIGGPVNTAAATVSALDAAANIIVGNGEDGIRIDLSSPGDVTTIQGNLMSRNAQNGIHFLGDLTGDVLQVQILDNLVGTTPDGTSTYDPTTGVPQGNGLDGIRLDQTGTGADVSTAGGPAALVSGNVSSGNALSGINVETAFPTETTRGTTTGTMTGTTTGTQGISYARVLILGNKLGTDAAGANTSALVNGLVGPFGNALDGILLNEILGATIGATTADGTAQPNVISGNLGRGIETRGDLLYQPVSGSMNLIQDNLVGTDSTGEQVLGTTSATDLGNLSDGIFLLDPGPTQIQSNTVSNNRGAGIHAVDDAHGTPLPSNGLVIAGNLIGTDHTGLQSLAGSTDFGNGSDGLFLDSIKAAVGAMAVAIDGNVVSVNHANGISLLNSSGVEIQGNQIGTNTNGTNDPTQAGQDFGNAADGLFINQSNSITIGDPAAPSAGSLTGAGNVISGNHGDGIFVSGTNNTLLAAGNIIAGNFMGLDRTGFKAIPNAVAGIILSNAGSTTAGAGNTIANNAISGNRLYGVLLINHVENNLVSGNRIGTDMNGAKGVPNSADGVFLLGATNPQLGATSNGPITGNTITGNVISGNHQDGIQIFGGGAFGNRFTGNRIGLGQDGSSVPNGADGILLNAAGTGNSIGGGGAGQGNVISGNRQSGVELTNGTSGTAIVGNLIGIDPTGTSAQGNSAYGVLIYASSQNTIGGTTTASGTGLGNVIAGNAQAGIQIFSPGTSAPSTSTVGVGNEIGTNAAGTAGLGNGSDGVQIINGSNNSIGGATPDRRNLISGNAANGVSIFAVPGLTAVQNTIAGNFIGTNVDGSAAIPNQGNGVLITDGAGTLVGGLGLGAGVGLVGGTVVPSALGGPGNLIAGNLQWGIQIEVTGSSTASSNTVQGNYIGTGARGTVAIANQLGGVLVNDLTTQPSSPIPLVIGGAIPGAGNLISGNTDIGVELLGPQITNLSGTNNVVQGNLIGLSTAGGTLGNGTGIFVNNSPNNLIGGGTPRPGTGPGNVISGNSQTGIQVFGQLSVGNAIQGNAIGTNATADGFPTDGFEGAPQAQTIGVLINGGSGDLVGGLSPGVGNVISGNIVGIQVSGLRQSNGQFVGSGNFVQANRIGTDWTGTVPVPNLDLGIFINQGQGNQVGPGNLISTNGIAGVEIFGSNSTHNLVSGDAIGPGSDGRMFLPARGQGKTLRSSGPQPGIPIYPNAQLNGVVILGASQNIVGQQPNIGGSQPNLIKGNVEVGVYITSRDFAGNSFSAPVNNAVSGNIIQKDGFYGILLFDAPNNAARPFTSSSRRLMPNRFRGNKINFRNFLSGFDIKTRLVGRGSPSRPARHAAHQAASHPAHARVVHRHPVAARPAVPALLHASAPQGQAQALPLIIGDVEPQQPPARRRGG